MVVPVEGTDWDTTKTFVQAFAQTMAADEPVRYLAKMTASLRRENLRRPPAHAGADLGRAY